MNAVHHQQFSALDRDWAESAIRELVARGADRGPIGEALATADAHCADSGESAEEAFGSPREFAASVHLRPGDVADERIGRQLRAARPTILGLAGMMLAFRVLDSHLSGKAVEVTLGDLLGVAAILAVAILAVRHVGLLLRHRVASMVVGWPILTGVILLPALVTPVLSTVPVALGAAVATIAVVGSGVWATAIGAEPEAVPDPRPGAVPARTSTAFVVVSRWLFVVATLVGCGLVYVIHAAAG